MQSGQRVSVRFEELDPEGARVKAKTTASTLKKAHKQNAPRMLKSVNYASSLPLALLVSCYLAWFVSPVLSRPVAGHGA